MEYYLSRGMDINPPYGGPNLSFFFSNGMDPEYAVMVCRTAERRRGASEFAGQMP
jgi:methylmalonyl-CoA mutase N-terminal domain/subunit